MKKTITEKHNYIKYCDVEKLPVNYQGCSNYNVFGKNIKLYTDPWMHHLHLKVTDICNANCSFCVEKNCKKRENSKHFLENLDKTLSELKRAGLLYSVSVTGGEPTLFKNFDTLCEILSRHKIPFLTMNTNGFWLEKHISKIDGLFDFVNISRHSTDDEKNNLIFNTSVLSVTELKTLKQKFSKTKMRIQCVMSEVLTVEDMNNFISVYSFADDISFRRLMEVGEEYDLDYSIQKDDYIKCLDYAFNNWAFKEQTIQDYYVYEIYNTGEKDVTFSYSNMSLLRKIEKKEDENFFREFILHPDGTLSGSWGKDNKILIY